MQYMSRNIKKTATKNLMEGNSSLESSNPQPIESKKLMKNSKKHSTHTPQVIMNETHCINSKEEAIHFVEMSGLLEKLLGAIRYGIQEACASEFVGILEDAGVWYGEIDMLCDNRDNFTTVDSISDYLDAASSSSVGSMHLQELDGVEEHCTDISLVVDGKDMPLVDFMSLNSLTVEEFIDMQTDWGVTVGKPLASLMLNSDIPTFREVYGEDANNQWLSPEWDGSKRIAPKNRKHTA